MPDTVISASDYLIIWADNDTEQSGLHASFKLSSSGETIYLSNPDTVLIDRIGFGNQLSDQSYGRIPNGTGAFAQMSPTPGDENNDNTTGLEEERTGFPDEFVLSQNYPNPFILLHRLTSAFPKEGFTH